MTEGDLNSIVAGSKLPLPPEVYERTLGGVNGLDLPADNPPPAPAPTLTPEAQEFNNALVDAFNSADQAAADIKAQYPDTVQVADAGGSGHSAVVSDAGGGLLPVNTNTAANTFTNFLDTQGSSLTPAQQETLAAQVNSLGLGGEADLSFYSLPGDLGAATGYLQLAQGLQSGDNLVIANGLNVISDGALDSAMKHAIGNIAAGTHAGEAANDDEMREVA